MRVYSGPFSRYGYIFVALAALEIDRSDGLVLLIRVLRVPIRQPWYWRRVLVIYECLAHTQETLNEDSCIFFRCESLINNEELLNETDQWVVHDRNEVKIR